MAKQYWADASTTNCLWLLQVKEINYNSGGCVCRLDYDEDGLLIEDDDNKCQCYSESWRTVAASLHRSEVFYEGWNRSYNYGKFGEDWRIYGIPCIGELPFLLSSQVNQEYIDKNVEEFQRTRPNIKGNQND